MLDAAKIDELAKLTPEQLVEALGPELDSYVRMLRKIEAAANASNSLLTFMRYIMPDPNDPDNVDKSRYEVHRLHEVLGEALEKVQKGEMLRLAISMPPQMGKQCSHDTPVLTTEGWKLHGDLRVGDRVFGSDGSPTEVIAVSDESLGDMEVEFADGERIHCHARHEWAVFDRALGGAPLRVLETKEIMESGVRIGAAQGRGGRARFSVDWIPVRGEFKNLPVDPYTLGAWLGDGSVGKAAITHHCDDSGVVERIGKLYRKSAAWTHKDTGAVTTSFSGEESGLSTALKKSGVYYSKGIPDAYLTASVEQRVALLAGLMDTDGCIHRPSRRASYVSANARLADDVAVLVRSLGMRATVVADEPRISSSGIVGKQVIYTVSFSPSIPIPCELPRKRISGFKVQYRRRGIVAVRRVAPKLGRCIQVAADDGIYLVGRGLVPTHNSAICTRGFPAWYMGKTPWRNVIVGTYNQTFAGDFGEDVRAIMLGQRYADVFKTRLRTGSKSKEQLVTEEGGKISFIGRDGSGTGKSADLFIIDDPYKNKADADSLATRDEVWGFFTRVMNTRMLNTGAVIIIHTRWHEDDLIGRLTDPTNPHYNADVAKHWTYINIPEIMDDEKIASILGKKVGDALWPERRSLEMLKVARLMDPVGFSALHMGKPTPPEGAFYQIEHLKGYEHKQLPTNLRYYLSGDLAVSTKYGADKTAVGVWGVDESPEPSLWLLPTLYWKKAGADEWVEWMLDQCKAYGILTAFMEKGQIDTAIGPFLERRMMERARDGKGNYVHIEKFPVVGDKGRRSQSFRTLCAMGRVRFPTFAPWWPSAKEQLLKFTGTGNDKEDDFCDMCGIMGQGAAQLIGAGVKKENNVIEPKVGTLAWTRWAADREKARAVPGRIKRAW